MTKEEVLSDLENTGNLVVYMSETNTPEFNLNKALEEATEFMEVAIKLKTKSTKNPKRPKRSDVLEEYTDFCLRGMVYVKSLFPEKTLEEVSEMIILHGEKKTNALFGWLKSGKYENGL